MSTTIAECRGLVGVKAEPGRGFRVGVQGVVGRTSICSKEYWLFLGEFCSCGLAGRLCARRSVRGPLEQFAAVQARKRAVLLVSKIANFSDFVFGPRGVRRRGQEG